MHKNDTSVNSSLVLSIPDMECPGCAGKVESAILGVAGVNHVTTSVVAQRVTVLYQPGPSSTNEIRDAIKQAGYTVGRPSDETRVIPRSECCASQVAMARSMAASESSTGTSGVALLLST